MLQLTEQQKQILDMVNVFAEEQIWPHALQWDANSHFPNLKISVAANYPGSMGL